MKIAIVGSRDYPDLDKVRKMIQDLNRIYLDDLVIVSGGARGADKVAELEAIRLGVKTEIYPVKSWYDADGKYNPAAGMIRNREIVNVCDKVIAFWDGKSHGTQGTINIANRQGKEVIVIVPSKLELF
jgi:predicted Rossmann fold nucleotide-binding protein DprA/Smf involved in DNA uptake